MTRIASLKSALDSAIQTDVKLHGQFMVTLQSDIREIVDTLSTVYKMIDPAVTISVSGNSFGEVSVHYSRENYTEQQFIDAVSKCHEEGSDIDDINVFDDYSWTIKMDKDHQKFLLEYDSLAPELEAYNHVSYDIINEESFSLTEAGYQSLVCRVADVFNHFIPPKIKLGYFEETSRRQYQQTLSFVI